MKYIVELDENMVHQVYFKRWWFSKKKSIGTIESGGIVGVKDWIVIPYHSSNFVRYDFVNVNKPELSKKNQKFL